MSKVYIGSKTRRGNSVLTPENSGMASVAQRRLNQAVGQAVKKHDEAMRVDGIPVIIWNKTRSGRPCSCTTKTLPSTGDTCAEELSTDASDVTIHLGLSSVDSDYERQNPSIKKKPEAEDVLNLTDFPPTGVTVRGADSSTYGVKGTGLDILKNLTTGPTSGLKGNPDLCEDDADADGIPDSMDDDYTATEEVVENYLEDDYLGDNGNTSILANLYGGRNTLCAICYGSQWTDGYQPVNGKRVVLDITAAPDNNGFELDLDKFPTTFSATDDSSNWIGWTIGLPKYYDAAISFNVHNNTETITHTVDMFSLIDGNEVKIDLDYLNSSEVKDKVTISNVRVRPKGTSNSGDDVVFTHVEIVYQLSAWPLTQMPPIEEALSAEDGFEIITSTSMEFGGSIPNITREAVIEEMKTRRIFKVENLTHKETSLNQSWGWDVDARMIQSTSLLYLMKQSSSSVVIPRNFTYLQQQQQLPGSKEKVV